MSIQLSAFWAFFQACILSFRWCSLTSLIDRSIWFDDSSTSRTFATTVCPSRTWSRTFLIQPEATSLMWQRPRLSSYSSRSTNTPKSAISSTSPTTNSPGSGQPLYFIRGFEAVTAPQRFRRSRRGTRPPRRSGSRASCRRPRTTPRRRPCRRRPVRSRNRRRRRGGNLPPCLLLERESAGAPSLAHVGLAAVAAAVLQVGLLGRLVATGHLRVPAGVADRREGAASLARVPLHSGRPTRSNLLHLVLLVGVTVRTVRVETTWHLHGYRP